MQGSTLSDVTSRVRYRITGNASFVREVMTSSPVSPYGSTSPVSGSMISGIKWSSKIWRPFYTGNHRPRNRRGASVWRNRRTGHYLSYKRGISGDSIPDPGCHLTQCGTLHMRADALSYE